MSWALIRYALWPVRSLAKEYMFNSTLDVFRTALATDSTSEAAEILITSASGRSEEFWMDVMILAAFIIIVLLLVILAVRMFCWVCIGLPRAGYEIEQIRQGKKESQIKSKAERAEWKRRQDAGLEEKPGFMAEDMQMLVSVMGQVRGRLNDKGVELDQLVTLPPQEPMHAEDTVATKLEY